MISESAGNYLEIIYILSQNRCWVQSVDIARALEVTRSSVSTAMKCLEKDQLIVKTGRKIHLTKKGYELACHLYKKHQILTQMLMYLANIDENKANEESNRLKYYISDETCQKIEDYLVKTINV